MTPGPFFCEILEINCPAAGLGTISSSKCNQREASHAKIRGQDREDRKEDRAGTTAAARPEGARDSSEAQGRHPSEDPLRRGDPVTHGEAARGEKARYHGKASSTYPE